MRPGHRLPAPRRREDRREHDVQPVRPVHGPPGLPRAHREQRRLRHRRREARRPQAARPLRGDPRAHLRDGPHLVPPPRHRRLRDGYRRLDGVHVHLQRAREALLALRGAHRRPLHDELHPHRRRHARPPGRLARQGRGLLRRRRTHDRRGRQAPHPQRHLPRAHRRHRRHLEGDGAFLRPHRPEPPRFRRAVRPPQGQALLRLRAV